MPSLNKNIEIWTENIFFFLLIFKWRLFRSGSQFLDCILPCINVRNTATATTKTHFLLAFRSVFKWGKYDLLPNLLCTILGYHHLDGVKIWISAHFLQYILNNSKHFWCSVCLVSITMHLVLSTYNIIFSWRYCQRQ